MSLYGQYLKELLGKHIVEHEHGFIVYSFTNDSCYIENIYVEPEFRNSNVASNMADEVVLMSKQKGLTKLMGSVTPNANNSTISLKVLLAYGFTLNSSTNNFILFEKAI